ncbi:MAG: hypothetical protein HKN82_00140, partial [Akkermansiaceae bacterium]|nr:hypothetical protein [Akkermansiaceae bacterium]
YYTDPDGNLWTARDVRQGRSVTLEPAAAPEFNRWLAAQKARFATRNRQRLERTATRHGHFLASSGGVPAIETLRSIDWTETGAVLTGPVAAP